MKAAYLKTTALALAMSVATTGIALADKANDTLRVAYTKELENVDSYFNSSREGVVLQRAVWDGLIYRDPITNEYKGNLATSWEWIDDKILELKLREGVTFHDGSTVDANDVVVLAHHRVPPALAHVSLQLDAERAIVIHSPQPAVDLGGRKQEAAALRERDDCVEVGHVWSSKGSAKIGTLGQRAGESDRKSA